MKAFLHILAKVELALVHDALPRLFVLALVAHIKILALSIGV